MGVYCEWIHRYWPDVWRQMVDSEGRANRLLANDVCFRLGARCDGASLDELCVALAAHLAAGTTVDRFQFYAPNVASTKRRAEPSADFGAAPNGKRPR